MRADLFVDPKKPRLDVCVVLVRNMVDREDRAVLFRVTLTTLWPEGWVRVLLKGFQIQLDCFQ
jgi:hypothetical protein